METQRKNKANALKASLGLPVSCLACRELGSHHSILTKSKKPNTLKNQQLFLDLSEKLDHRAKCCTKNWRHRWADTDNHNLPEQKLINSNLLGAGSVVGNLEQ